jgi:hypothetical protein
MEFKLNKEILDFFENQVETNFYAAMEAFTDDTPDEFEFYKNAWKLAVHRLNLETAILQEKIQEAESHEEDLLKEEWFQNFLNKLYA